MNVNIVLFDDFDVMVAYGIDAALGLIEDTIDIDVAIKVAEQLGYAWDSESREGVL